MADERKGEGREPRPSKLLERLRASVSWERARDRIRASQAKRVIRELQKQGGKPKPTV